jgi:membrane-associated protease RseP (regulator of RpoE activity)
MALSTPTMGPALGTRVLGIPFRIELPFTLVLGALGYVGGRSAVAAAEWIVLGGLSIAVHELGHAFAFRAFGVAPRIRLHGWGGETHGATLTPARDVVVSAAGPLTGLAIGGVCGWQRHSARSRRASGRDRWVAALVWINVGWSVFNLLPIRPLDGSAIARTVLGALMPTRSVALCPPRGSPDVLARASGPSFAGLPAQRAWRRKNGPGAALLRQYARPAGSERRARRRAPQARSTSARRIRLLIRPFDS